MPRKLRIFRETQTLRLREHRPPLTEARKAKLFADTHGFYACAHWRRLRTAFLARNPLCADPEGRHPGIPAPANEVDHIVPRLVRPDLVYDWDNLQALCKSCHSRKTRLEEDGRDHG